MNNPFRLPVLPRNTRLAAGFAGSLFLAAGVSGATTTAVWGGGNGNWTDANWTVNGVSGQTLTTSFSATDIYAVTISGGSVSLGATTLNFNGATFGLTGDGTGTLSGTSNIGMLAGGAGNPVSVANVGLAFTYVIWTNGSAATPYLYPSFGAGSYTFSDANAFRTVNYSFDTAGINVTAASGAFSLSQTNNTAGTTELVDKLSGGFFKIDGTQVKVSGSYDGTNPSSLATLNAALLSNAVNGKAFQVAYNAGIETLSVVAVPEPATYGLAGAGALAVLALRRRRNTGRRFGV